MSRIRILVAEDEALIRMDLVEMLTESGYEVIAQASNGAEAIELAKEHKPDLAILDVKMPVLDGISAAEEIISIAPVPIFIKERNLALALIYKSSSDVSFNFFAEFKIPPPFFAIVS